MYTIIIRNKKSFFSLTHTTLFILALTRNPYQKLVFSSTPPFEAVVHPLLLRLAIGKLSMDVVLVELVVGSYKRGGWSDYHLEHNICCCLLATWYVYILVCI